MPHASLLASVCQKGHYDTAVWLVTNFELPYPRHGQMAIRGACGAHALRLVQWLDARYRVDRCEFLLLMESAAGAGDLATMQWLAERFVIEAADVRADDYLLLDYAREAQHLAMFQWLALHCGLDRPDARKYLNRLRPAAADPVSEIICWLREWAAPASA